MIEWTISSGNIATMGILLVSLVMHGFWQAWKLETLIYRMAQVEKITNLMSEMLIKVAESRTEIKLLSDRINDISEHGSRRLSELLSERDGKRRRDGD